MVKEVKKIMHHIKTLKIQGARRVAAATAKALVLSIKKSKAKTKEEILREIEHASQNLLSLRPTEPMARNTLRFFFAKLEHGRDVEEIKKLAEETMKIYDKQFTDAFLKITEYGSELIWDGQTILTHCHSTTVNSILVRASKKKKIKVYCTETRPLYQGHKTAKELASAKVDVTMIVDSAVKYIMKDVDLVMVGADAIATDGSLYNKIGTSTIATVANDMKIPFYSATQIYKFDPLTKFGKMTEIEMRDPKEVLPKPIKGLKVINPAFDVTLPQYIRAYITEIGIIPPQNVMTAVEKYLSNQ
ncbi:MAG: S-methyl-5-thioribose-1-phosphate isomerase [Candidatus Micrarchaeota archaeon]|nr:S-methyl-5-thioribose-1-phosphate isomerase [Candidatus Micrarchaeota archaeon]